MAYDTYEKNPKFNKEVFNRTKTTMTDKPFTDEQYKELSKYILDEFSVVYSGISYQEDYYGLFFYPNMDETAYFFEDLKDGKIFPELNKNLPKEKVALAIIN